MPIAYIHKTGTVFEKKMEKREIGGRGLPWGYPGNGGIGSKLCGKRACLLPTYQLDTQFYHKQYISGLFQQMPFYNLYFSSAASAKESDTKQNWRRTQNSFYFSTQIKNRPLSFFFFFPRFVLQSFFCSALCDRFFLLFSSLLVLAPPHCCFRMKIYKCGEGRKTSILDRSNLRVSFVSIIRLLLLRISSSTCVLYT